MRRCRYQRAHRSQGSRPSGGGDKTPNASRLSRPQRHVQPHDMRGGGSGRKISYAKRCDSLFPQERFVLGPRADATTATLTESIPLHAQRADVTLPHDPLAARARPPSRPQFAGIPRPRELRHLGVLAEVLQDPLDDRAVGISTPTPYPSRATPATPRDGHRGGDKRDSDWVRRQRGTVPRDAQPALVKPLFPAET